jgi:hypothetical protein
MLGRNCERQNEDGVTESTFTRFLVRAWMQKGERSLVYSPNFLKYSTSAHGDCEQFGTDAIQTCLLCLSRCLPFLLRPPLAGNHRRTAPEPSSTVAVDIRACDFVAASQRPSTHGTVSRNDLNSPARVSPCTKDSLHPEIQCRAWSVW